MCAPNSLLPPFPTNPLSQHRQHKSNDMSCVVTLQCGNIMDSCLVFFFFLAESLPGPCKNFLEALITANNAHQLGGMVRALARFSGDTMSKLAEVWCEWCGLVGSGSALEWC